MKKEKGHHIFSGTFSLQKQSLSAPAAAPEHPIHFQIPIFLLNDGGGGMLQYRRLDICSGDDCCRLYYKKNYRVIIVGLYLGFWVRLRVGDRVGFSL